MGQLAVQSLTRDRVVEACARELFALERHMAAGGDYWEFMHQRHPEYYRADGTMEPGYKALLLNARGRS